MRKIITFIVPAYNSEPYLKKCLNSFVVKDETIKELIEVIIVNDGSSDQTPHIAQKYVKQYPGVFRLINKENGGHGSAINVGSLEAKGRYMKVIDADDWVITENLPAWIRILEKCLADVVLTPYHLVDMSSGERSIWCMHCDRYQVMLTFADIMAEWKSYDRCLTFHGITYRTEFYNKYRHELPEKVFYEDQEYAAIPCCQASSIYAINIFIYQYMVGNAAQSVSDANRLKRISHVEQVTNNLLKFWNKEVTLERSAKEYLFKKTESLILSHYVVVCLIQKDKKKGRCNAKKYHDMILRIAPEIGTRIEKKYKVYLLMNYCHMPHTLYQKLLHSRLYSIIRKSYRIEKEARIWTC